MSDFHIVSLYHDDMNIYGDTGNILAIKKRVEQYGLRPILHEYNPGDTFPETVHLILGGGGQDSGQSAIYEDLRKISKRLHELADAGVPMLMICGMYQLFGHEFITNTGESIKGIGLLDVTTRAGADRLIGNIVTQSDEFGELVGYENHSGQTTLGPNATPFATVVNGEGNNKADRSEGARYKNVIGSYLHGPLLPKNPHFTDWLIHTAAKAGNIPLKKVTIDDSLANQAHTVATTRPR